MYKHACRVCTFIYKIYALCGLLAPVRTTVKSEFTNTDDAYEHNTENASEYFATAFAVYILMPDKLYELCPDTYEYINRVVSKNPQNAEIVNVCLCLSY